MPSEDYNRLTDADLAALVAYVRALPVAQGGVAIVQMPLPARVLYGLGAIPDAAQRSDLRLPPQAPLAASDVAAANLTPGEGSSMVRYKDADTFLAMLKSGKRPDGSLIAVMPFESLSRLDETEPRALYAYLKTVPPRPAGQH